MAEAITGRIIANRYRVTGLHRRGRMGDLYVGRRIDTDERVSVKLLDPTLFGNAEAKRRFERETKITARLDNPCTLVVLDYGETDDGLPFMILEYVDGEQLSDVIENGPLAPERAAYIAAQIAMALSEAHSIGVVHRDLAPEIVLITDEAGQSDSVKVLDFGLSRLQEGEGDGEASALTAVGVRIGTPAYMAPEYIETHTLDHRADLYALGILIFEMCTGAPPFTGRPYKVLDRHLTAEPPKLDSVVPNAPPWLTRLVARLLEKDPEDRIQTADEVIRRIEKGLQHRLRTVQTQQVTESMVPAVEDKRPEPQKPVAEEQPPDQPAPPSPSEDPLFEEFLTAQILEQKPASRIPDPTNSFVVGRVARHSIASRLGVEPGWLVEIPDLMPGNALVDTAVFDQPVERRSYLFASPDGARKLEVTTTGAEPGLDLMRSSRHVRHFQAITDDPEPLLDVWRQGDWETLEKLAWKTITQQRGAAGVLNTGMFARFLGAATIKQREHPALLFHGAAMIETGKDLAEALDFVREYKEQYSVRFAPEYDAIAHFYLAWAEMKRGDKERALDLLVQSWIRWPSLRVQEKIAELTGFKPDTRAWYGRRFPDYRLDEVQGPRSVHLYEYLPKLEDHEVVVICMMGGFRGNPEYDAFMRRFMCYQAHFAPFISGLQVVTHRTLRDEDRPEHYGGEDLVRNSAVEFVVLEDYRAFVQRAVKPPQIPTIYAVDREGWVVYEGRMDPVGLWEMLATAAQVRLQRGVGYTE